MEETKRINRRLLHPRLLLPPQTQKNCIREPKKLHTKRKKIRRRQMTLKKRKKRRGNEKRRNLRKMTPKVTRNQNSRPKIPRREKETRQTAVKGRRNESVRMSLMTVCSLRSYWKGRILANYLTRYSKSVEIFGIQKFFLFSHFILGWGSVGSEISEETYKIFTFFLQTTSRFCRGNRRFWVSKSQASSSSESPWWPSITRKIRGFQTICWFPVAKRSSSKMNENGEKWDEHNNHTCYLVEWMKSNTQSLWKSHLFMRGWLRGREGEGAKWEKWRLKTFVATKRTEGVFLSGSNEEQPAHIRCYLN
jgi:hypothetical protein